MRIIAIGKGPQPVQVRLRIRPKGEKNSIIEHAIDTNKNEDTSVKRVNKL